MIKNKNSIDLNSPDRYFTIQYILKNKTSLRSIYEEVYNKYQNCIKQSPADGLVIEIGSGAGFAKEIIPNLVTTDIVAYPNIEFVMDAAKLKFQDNSLACICMFNVLHHLPNSPSFFQEAIRCLRPNGRLLMIEPYPGLLSAWIYKYLHHEKFDSKTTEWEFTSSGPVSDANIALPYIIFERDLTLFKTRFPELELVRYQPFMLLRYWLTGGLQNWTLLPKWANYFAKGLDNILIKLSKRFGSFVEIELIKKTI